MRQLFLQLVDDFGCYSFAVSGCLLFRDGFCLDGIFGLLRLCGVCCYRLFRLLSRSFFSSLECFCFSSGSLCCFL